MSRTLAIICSDETKNGKTLFGRLLADTLSLSGDDSFRIFDTDFPAGNLAGYFPASSQIVDFSKTAGQLAIFDTIMAEPDHDYLIDLDARYLEQFFTIHRDIGFAEGARERGLAVTVYFVLDRTVQSVANALKIFEMSRGVQFLPVINEAIGNPVLLPQGAAIFGKITREREIILPRLSVEALNLIDQPDFSFAGFLANNGADVPLELRVEIWGFLESLYNQKQSREDGGAVIY